MKIIIIKCALIICLLAPKAMFAQEIMLSDKKLKILTLGDSNGTFPYSWPQQLQLALPNSQIFNLSKSGRTIGFLNLGDSSLNSRLVIDQNLKKASAFMPDRPYDYIILELGTNDAKAVFAKTQQDVAGNLAGLIDQIQNSIYPTVKTAKIVVISPPPYGIQADTTSKYKGGNARVKAMSINFRKVARKKKCLFVNGFKTPGLNVNTMTIDGLHLDATGSKNLILPLVKLFVKFSDIHITNVFK